MTPKERASHILDLAGEYANAAAEIHAGRSPDLAAAFERQGKAIQALCRSAHATVPPAADVPPPGASQPRHMAEALRAVLDCATPDARELFPEAFAMVEALWEDERQDMLDNPAA